jgi:hypothetical protein
MESSLLKAIKKPHGCGAGGLIVVMRRKALISPA